MKMTYNGLALTKQFEGCRLEAYQDSGGVWTVGYGHTAPEVRKDVVMTQEQADAALFHDIQSAVDCVNEAVTATLSQNKFDALVDFCFNVGRGAFLGSSLLHRVNLLDFVGAAAEFMKWINVDHRAVEGLVKRRMAERDLFLKPDDPLSIHTYLPQEMQ